MDSSYALLSIASVAIGLTYIVNKKLSTKSFKPATFTMTTAYVSALFAIPLLFFNFYIPLSIGSWLLVFISTAIFGLSSFFSFKAYKLIDASTVSLLHKLNVVIAATIGIMFLKEVYLFSSYIGLILIFFSSLLIVWDGKKIDLNKGILYAVLMAVTSALAGVLDKKIIATFSPFTYVFVNNFLIGVMFSFRKDSIVEGVRLLKEHSKLVLSTAVLGVGSWATFLFVLQNTSVSKTFPIYKSLSLIVPVIIGITFLKESNRLWQKIVGTLLGAVGILLLALG